MNHKLLLFGSSLSLAAMAVSAAIPSVQEDPALYGAAFRSRTPQKKVSAFVSKERPGGLHRVLAFAGEGCAEVERYGTLHLVVEEDFSKLTTGSEAEPDLKTSLEIPPYMLDANGYMILDENGNPIENPDFEYPWNNMKNEYTNTPGWGVGNAFPAGGMLYMPFSMQSTQGKINSHWLDLTAYDGTFVVEFRAKLSGEQNAEMPTGIIVEVAETNNMGPTWDMFEDSFINFDLLSQEWTTFRLLFQGAGPSTLASIVGQGVSGGLFVDDVKIYSLEPFVKAPALTGHSDFAEDSFTLNWEKVDDADHYLVDCWYIGAKGNKVYAAEKKNVTDNFLKVEGADMRDIFYYQVTAVKGDKVSLAKNPREVFDIVAPVMKQAVQIDDKGREFRGGVEPVATAYGYNYFAERQRTAEADGPFLLTNEDFAGWRHPLYEEGEFYTKENPANDKVASLWYPTDLKQQGWYGKNFQIYKDYVCLVPFFYTATNGQEQSCWVSPEFDLSRDGGKVSIDLSVAAEWDVTYEGYSRLAVALFEWNDSKGDYDQVEVVYKDGFNFDFKDVHVDLTMGGKRSVIGFFGLGTYGDLYLDNIRIAQNFKQGETFHDPFFFRTWQLAESEEYADDPTTFEFTVPAHASGSDIYQKAQAVRMHLNSQGGYDGEKASAFSDNNYVAHVDAYVDGVSLVVDELFSQVSAADGVVRVSNPERLEVSVISADGKSFRLGNGESIAWRAPAAGVYVVSVGKSSIKIAI